MYVAVCSDGGSGDVKWSAKSVRPMIWLLCLDILYGKAMCVIQLEVRVLLSSYYKIYGQGNILNPVTEDTGVLALDISAYAIAL